MSKVLEKLHLRSNKDSSNTSSNTMAPNLPKTYKAVVIEEANAPWAIKDVELKMPEENQILVKVHACGVCHSDVAVQMGMMGPM